MISFTQFQTMFGELTQNTTSANLTLGAQLMNIEQKYLLQKYFNNEESFSITTVGSQSLNLTASPAVGATSATLATVWVYPSCQTQITFSDGELRTANLTNGATTLTWQGALTGTTFALATALSTGATSGILQTAWSRASQATSTIFGDGETKTVTYTQNSTAISWTGGLTTSSNASIRTSIITVAIGVGGVQAYNLPADYSKLKTGTLTIGALKWTPIEVLSREQWDNLNVFPYYADIPSNFFIWNNQFQLWPIPSTTGSVISFNYKRRVPDLSIADYTTPGTLTVTNGSTTITGVGTGFTPTINAVGESRYIQIAQPAGDNLWYQIASIASTTVINLVAPYQGITTSVTALNYTIGQMPVLVEDFQDMILWKTLIYYFTAIVDNPGKRKQYEMMYNEKLELLAEYAGTKTVQVNLSRRPYRGNPNIFPQSIG